MKTVVFYPKKQGGQFAPKMGDHFKLKKGGQYHWNLHFMPQSFGNGVDICPIF